MSVLTGQGVTAYPLPDEELSPTSKNAVSNEAVCEGLDEIKNTLNRKADTIYDTESGDIASFPDGADGLPVKALTVGIEPVQSGTGDPSPTNVRPISGWTGANVTKTGKNLQPHILQSAATSKGYTATPQSDGTIVITGTWIGTANGVIGGAQSAMFMLKAGQYILNGNELSMYTEYGIRLQLIDSSTYTYGFDSGNGLTFTLTADTVVSVRIYVTNSIATGKTIPDSGVTLKPMIRLASESNDTFEPYNDTVSNISWQSSAGTVYGGTLDVTSGVLTVDRAMETIPEQESITVASYGVSYAMITLQNSMPNIQNKAIVISEKAKGVAFADRGQSPYLIYYSGPTSVVLRADVGTTLQEFNDLYAGSKIVYRLATPLVIQLDPVTVTTLLGQNNVWSDTGSSTVEYPCDTKLYIDKKLAALVAALS